MLRLNKFKSKNILKFFIIFFGLLLFTNIMADETSTIYWAVDGENCNNSESSCSLTLSNKSISGSHYASGKYVQGEGVYSGESFVGKDYVSSITEVNIGSENDLIKPYSLSEWFFGMNKLRELDFTYLDTSRVTNMSYMFYNASSLTSLDLSNFDTSKVEDFSSMFYGMSSLVELDLSNFNFSRVVLSSNMLDNTNSLRRIKTPRVYPSSLPSIKLFRTFEDEDGNSYIGLFEYSTNTWIYYSNTATLTSGSYFNIKIKSLAGNENVKTTTCDQNIKKIMKSNTLPDSFVETNDNIISTTDSNYPIFAWYNDGIIYYYSKAENIYLNSDSNNMFNRMLSLEELDLSNFNASKATNISSMFYEDKNLRKINLINFDTSKVTNMGAMFWECRNLKSLDLSSFDMSNLEYAGNMFYKNNSLREIKTPKVSPSVSVELPGTFEDDSGNYYTSFYSIPASTSLNYSKISTLDTGYNVKEKIEKTVPRLYSNIFLHLQQIEKILRSDTLPQNYVVTTDNTISLSNSNYPVYIWFKDKILYYYSEAEKIFLNYDSKILFSDLHSLKIIDLSNFDTSKVYNMQAMFSADRSLEIILVSDNWDTSKVSLSLEMFSGCTSLKGQNGTTFDDTKTDKEYARIDQEGTKGYFSNEINAEINTDSIILNVGDSYSFSFSPSIIDGSLFSWDTSDSSIVSVDNNGVITAIKRGSAIIYATYKNKKTYQINILVKEPKVLSIDTESDLYNVYSSDPYFNLEYSIQEQDNPKYELHFSSDNSNVIYTDSNKNFQSYQRVFIKGTGTANVTISAGDIQKTVAINVIYVPKVYYNNELSDVSYKISMDNNSSIISNSIECAGCSPVHYDRFYNIKSGLTGKLSFWNNSIKYYNKPLVKITKRSNNEDVTNEVLNDNIFVMPNYDINIIAYQVRASHFLAISYPLKYDDFTIFYKTKNNEYLINYNDNESYHYNDYISYSYEINDNGGNSNDELHRISDIKIYKIDEKDFESYMSGEKITNKIDVTNELNPNIKIINTSNGRKAYNIDFDFPKYDVLIEPVVVSNVFNVNLIKNDDLYSINYNVGITTNVMDLTNKTIGGREVYFTFQPKGVYESKEVMITDSNGNEIEHTYSYSGLTAAVHFIAPYSDITIKPIVDRKPYKLTFYNLTSTMEISSYWKDYRVILNYDGPERTANPVFNIYRASNNKLVNDLVEFDGKSFVMPDFNVIVKISSGPVTLIKPSLTITQDNNKVELNFDKQIDADKYEIYVSNNNKKWKHFVNITDNKYTIKKLTFGKKYYYKVRACYGKKCSSFSNIVNKKIVPNKVTLLTATSIGTNNIKLFWSKVNTTGYEVYMNGKKITTIKKNETISFNMKKLKANTTYKFKVRAYKTVKKKKIYGPFSTTISVKTAPAKPSLSLSLKSLTEMNIKIGSVNGASKYTVQKSLDGKTYELLEDLTGAKTLVASELEIGKTYYYRVRACNTQDRCSGWVTKSLQQTPKTPSYSLKTTSKKVTVTLKSVEDADGYEIHRATKKKGKYSKVKDLNADTLIYNNGIKKGKAYYYKVRSYKIVNSKRVYSPYSKVKNIKSK